MVTYAALTVINLSPYDSLILQMLHDEIEYFEGLLNRRHRLAEHQSLWCANAALSIAPESGKGTAVISPPPVSESQLWRLSVRQPHRRHPARGSKHVQSKLV
jgi:hypothetical protein